MIHSVIIFNTSGVPRLIKFYTPIHQSAQTVVSKIYSLVSTRPPGSCNFLEAPELDQLLGRKDVDEKLRVVYRSYATLHFVFVVDLSESELGMLDLIQVFVEALDRAFENVCELDLVFHFDEVHHILAEIIQGGVVLETNLEVIDSSGESLQSRLKNFVLFPQNRDRSCTADLVHQAASARKQSFAAANPLALGVGGVGPRNAGLQTPLGWLTGKLTGVGAR